MSQAYQFKKAYFNKENSTIKLDNQLCTAIKLKPFTYSVKEKSDEGNGWYGKSETKVYHLDNVYAIVKENKEVNIFKYFGENLVMLVPLNQCEFKKCIINQLIEIHLSKWLKNYIIKINNEQKIYNQ